MPRSLRSYVGSVRDLPLLRDRLEVLERDQRVLGEQMTRMSAAAAQLEAISAQLSSIHRTLEEADPQMAYEIITAVRDDVRTLIVEVTEQSNRVGAALVELHERTG